MTKKMWLLSNDSRLVELYSSRRIEVRSTDDGSLGVWLCANGQDLLLYEGPESRQYVAGLAEILGAGNAQEILRFGGRTTKA